MFPADEWWIRYSLAGIGDDNHFLREFNDNSGILGRVVGDATAAAERGLFDDV